MQVFVRKPSVDLYPGIKVDKDTTISYKNEKIEQTIENLVLHTIARAKGENYESTYDTTIQLSEGDVLILDGDRGYIKPVEPFVTVEDAIGDLENIKDMG